MADNDAVMKEMEAALNPLAYADDIMADADEVPSWARVLYQQNNTIIRQQAEALEIFHAIKDKADPVIAQAMPTLEALMKSPVLKMLGGL